MPTLQHSLLSAHAQLTVLSCRHLPQVSPLLAAQGPLFGRALVLWPGTTLRSALVPCRDSATSVDLASRAWCLELARLSNMWLAVLLSLCQMLFLGQQGTFLRWSCGLIGLWSMRQQVLLAVGAEVRLSIRQKAAEAKAGQSAIEWNTARSHSCPFCAPTKPSCHRGLSLKSIC